MKTRLFLLLVLWALATVCQADLPAVKDRLQMPAIVLSKTPAEWLRLYRLSLHSPEPLLDVLEEYLQACERGEDVQWVHPGSGDYWLLRSQYAFMRLADIGGPESLPVLERFLARRLEHDGPIALPDAIAARVAMEQIQARLKGREAYIAEMMRWVQGEFTPWQDERLTRWNKLSEVHAYVEAPYRKRMALRVLGRLKVREAVPILLELCKEGWKWSEAHQALAEIGDRRALDAISRGLRDIDAAEFLPLEPGQVDPAWAYWQMRTQGMDPEQKVNAMVSALARNDARRGVVEILTIMGRPIVPYLLKALAQPPGPDTDQARCGVISALGNIRAAEAIEPLRQLLRQGPSAVVRGVIAEALGKIGDPSVIPDVVALLSDGDRSVRVSAVRALGEMKHPDAIHPLLKVLREHPDEFIRTHAAQALESTGMRWLVPILEYQRMVEPSPLVQQYLADAVIMLKRSR